MWPNIVTGAADIILRDARFLDHFARSFVRLRASCVAKLPARHRFFREPEASAPGA
jgi:hypothetical protein